jgi:outer membrane lipoprotein
MKKLLLLFAGIAFLAGCAHVISRDVLDQVDRQVTFAELQKDPLRYKGVTVLLGGVIVRTVMEKNGTLLEIYQTALDRSDRPVDLDRSEGRFLAHYKGFLDSEIWRKGRRVTVAGTVEGEKTRKLGNMEYRYPYLNIRQIHLWKKETYIYEPYPSYPWGPYGPWGPWWDPFPYPFLYPHPLYWHHHR